jgi:hypothetical protein
MWMAHMHKFFSVGITCLFLSGCIFVPAAVTNTVMGAVIVSAAVATANDRAECGEKRPRVFIASPRDGFVSEKTSVKVIFGSENVQIVPAGVVNEAEEDKCFAVGHHHLLVDSEDYPTSWIPFDDNHLHFGQGQTEAVIELKPGTHTLQLVLGNPVHNASFSINNFAGQGPFVSEKITIEVASSE